MMRTLIDQAHRPLVGVAIMLASILVACGSGQTADGGAPAPETGTVADGQSDEPETEPDAESAEGRSILDGVYTASQASRGEDQFQSNCSFCHSTGEFERIFSGLYANSTLDQLFGLISSTMPQSSPGSLAPQTYADIIGYFLELNGYPVGDEELPGDAEVLGTIQVESR